MSNIKIFNSKNIDEVIRPNIQKALDKVAEKLGMNIHLRSIRYNGTMFTGTIDAQLIDENDINILTTKKDLPYYTALKETGKLFSVSTKDYNTVITYDGWKYRFVGINPRARKSPYIFESLVIGESYYKFTDKCLSLLKKYKSKYKGSKKKYPQE